MTIKATLLIDNIRLSKELTTQILLWVIRTQKIPGREIITVNLSEDQMDKLNGKVFIWSATELGVISAYQQKQESLTPLFCLREIIEGTYLGVCHTI